MTRHLPRRAAAKAFWRTMALCVAVGLGVAGLPAARAELPASCVVPQPVVGQGSTTQERIHAALFQPAYYGWCPTAQGTVTYRGTGDPAAVRAALDRSNPFFAVDVPLTPVQKAQVEQDTSSLRNRSSRINHIPVLVNGFAVGYNLKSCPGAPPVRLTATTLSLVYSGAVTQWNDAALVRDNPGLASCAQRIKPAIRSDAGGPTLIFKDYLSKGNPAFAALKQSETASQWPPALTPTCRGVGESGMASCLSDPGSIAYVEWSVARARGVTPALLSNASGVFTGPSPDGSGWPGNCTAAAASAVVPPSTELDWSAVSLTNPLNGYSLCAFTYELVFTDMDAAYFTTLSPGQVKNVVDYMATMLGPGVQAQLPAFGYAPLPAAVADTARAGLAKVDT
jgi:phosphate transport system substrate-binding protein